MSLSKSTRDYPIETSRWSGDTGNLHTSYSSRIPTVVEHTLGSGGFTL